MGYMPIDVASAYFSQVTAAWRRDDTERRGRLRRLAWPLARSASAQGHLSPGGQHDAAGVDYGRGAERRPGGRLHRRGAVDGGRETIVATTANGPRLGFQPAGREPRDGEIDVSPGQGEKWWGKPWNQVRPEIIAMMAKRRLCPDRVQPEPVFKVRKRPGDGRLYGVRSGRRTLFPRSQVPVCLDARVFLRVRLGASAAPAFLGQQPYAGGPPFEKIDRGQLWPEFEGLSGVSEVVLGARQAEGLGQEVRAVYLG